MRALLWKEYREKRLWLLLLTASTVAVVLGSIGYTFLGAGGLGDRFGTLSDWSLLSVLAALLLGAGSFASELDKAAEFLLTRPVSWKKLLAAKVLMGTGVIVATALITALVFKVTVPEQYAHLATFSSVMTGAGVAIVLMGIGYSVGLACSAAIPGTVGGLLVALQIYGLMAVEMVAWQTAHRQNVDIPQCSWFIGFPLGMLIVLIVNARFGLTLPITRRYVRYIYIPAAAAVLLLPLDVAGLRPFDGQTARSERHVASIGPGGERALVSFPDDRMHVVDLAGRDLRLDRSLRTPIWAHHEPLGLRYQGYGWADASTVYCLNKVHAGRAQPENAITIVNVSKSRHVTQRTVRVLTSAVPSVVLLPSPSGKRVMAVPVVQVLLSAPWVASDVEHNRIIPLAQNWVAAPYYGGRQVDVVDIPSARVILRQQVIARDYFWQSENEIGYIDLQGKRHTVTL